MDERKSWQRMQDEPSRWYARFDRFRLLGPGRSLLAMYNGEREEAGKGRANRVPGRWPGIAAQWKWRERAEAWDEAERQKDEAEWERRRAEQREREWLLGSGLQAMAGTILAESPKFIKTRRVNTPDGKEIITMALDGRLAIKAADTGSKIARLAAGMETDKVKNKLGGHVEVKDVEAMRRKRWEQVVPRLAQALKDAGMDEDPGEEEEKDV